MSIIDDRDVNSLGEMTRVAQSFLNLDQWGFKVSYRSTKPGNLIYDSERCRVNFAWGGWDPLVGNSISIYYGRLHAPNEGITMIWNGEECYCWHRFEPVLHFLDGRPSEYASKKMYTHSLIEQYKQIDVEQGITGERDQPEWLVRMHAMVWEHYGERFFELFDLRRPDLWEQYRLFLKQIYDIKGRDLDMQPLQDKVC